MTGRSQRQKRGMGIGLGAGIGAGLGLVLASLMTADVALGLVFGAGIGLVTGLLVGVDCRFAIGGRLTRPNRALVLPTGVVGFAYRNLVRVHQRATWRWCRACGIGPNRGDMMVISLESSRSTSAPGLGAGSWQAEALTVAKPDPTRW